MCLHSHLSNPSLQAPSWPQLFLPRLVSTWGSAAPWWQSLILLLSLVQALIDLQPKDRGFPYYKSFRLKSFVHSLKHLFRTNLAYKPFRLTFCLLVPPSSFWPPLGKSPSTTRFDSPFNCSPSHTVPIRGGRAPEAPLATAGTSWLFFHLLCSSLNILLFLDQLFHDLPRPQRKVSMCVFEAPAFRNCCQCEGGRKEGDEAQPPPGLHTRVPGAGRPPVSAPD